MYWHKSFYFQIFLAFPNDIVIIHTGKIKITSFKKKPFKNHEKLRIYLKTLYAWSFIFDALMGPVWCKLHFSKSLVKGRDSCVNSKNFSQVYYCDDAESY